MDLFSERFSEVFRYYYCSNAFYEESTFDVDSLETPVLYFGKAKRGSDGMVAGDELCPRKKLLLVAGIEFFGIRSFYSTSFSVMQSTILRGGDIIVRPVHASALQE